MMSKTKLLMASKSIIFTALILSACTQISPTIATTTMTNSLKPCPDSPNCVSSQSTDEQHKITALPWISMTQLVSIIQQQARSQIIQQQDNYLKVLYKSRWWGFVDEVEFYFPPEQSHIEVRSASRTGYYDFGVNRQRVEQLRQQIQNQQNMKQKNVK